jgi:hypothetical protein
MKRVGKGIGHTNSSNHPVLQTSRGKANTRKERKKERKKKEKDLGRMGRNLKNSSNPFLLTQYQA